MTIAWPRPSADSPAATLIGSSPAMFALRATIRQVARTDVSVLVTGPSGSGKEVVARALHAASPRAGRPFIALNCAAIPRDLIEAELFGHSRGAFTGATESRVGRIEAADGGTLFLDEIGDMPADMQAKLLRVLEERRVDRLGGGQSRAVDVRIVAATHRDLLGAIERGAFREDLYFRLAVFPIMLPPLAERPEDVAELAQHFARGGASGEPLVRFSPGALAAMARAVWRGNVRELRNFVERATVMVEPGGTLDAAGAMQLLGPAGQRRAAAPGALIDAEELGRQPLDLDALLGGIEEHYIRAGLAASHGIVAKAARLLGLRRTTLLDRMRKHGVRAERPIRPVRRGAAIAGALNGAAELRV